MTSEPRRRPTMADVAHRAGTSTAVVSYVVNGGPRPVAAGTRALVEQAITDLGYRRNPLAGALVAGRTNLVGLLVPDSSNAFFSEMARHVEQEARRRGLLMLLGNTSYHPAAEQDYEAAFADLRAVGTLVTSIAAAAGPEDDCPRVYVHSKPADSAGPSVVFDDLNGAVEAVEHLRWHGYDDIHCVTGPDDFGPAGRRKEGWALALSRAGLPRRGKLHRAPFERLQAERRLREMLSSADPFPRAVFATTDEQALATMRAAFSLRLRVPEDLALIGFDGISEALHGWVRLTTVSVPLHELAVRAFDTLETWNSDGQEQSVVLPVTLAVGNTCGCT
jgi:LacI family transcriptional regulator